MNLHRVNGGSVKTVLVDMNFMGNIMMRNIVANLANFG